jgi:hypothetical protein
MNIIRYIDTDGLEKIGLCNVTEDRCECQGGLEQTICLPGDTGERGYGYSHGGASYRALIDAIVAAEGTEKILAARRAIMERRTTYPAPAPVPQPVWYTAHAHFEEGDKYLHRADDAVDTETLQVFDTEAAAMYQAREEGRSSLKRYLSGESLWIFCPVHITDELTEGSYARLRKILHGDETIGTFHGRKTNSVFCAPFREGITDEECDEVLEILPHLKWVVGSTEIKRST